MSERKKLKLPPVEKTVPVPMFAFVGRGGDNDERDPLKPLAVDADGNPLYYAPKGIMFRVPRR